MDMNMNENEYKLINLILRNDYTMYLTAKVYFLCFIIERSFLALLLQNKNVSGNDIVYTKC